MIRHGITPRTLRAVAGHADACNVGGSPDVVRHKYGVLLQLCEAQQRGYATIERTNIMRFLLASNDAALAAKRERLPLPASYYGFAGTIAQATDLIGRYQDAGVELLIISAFKNDPETHALLAV